MKAKETSLLLVYCLAGYLNAPSVEAQEYRFDVGQQRVFSLRHAEPPATFGCVLTVTCRKVADLKPVQSASGAVTPRKREYSLEFRMSEFGMGFEHGEKSTAPYERAMARLTNFSYDVVMDSAGTILACTYDVSAGRLDLGSVEQTSLIMNDMIRPLTVDVWRTLFPRFLIINANRVFFGPQKWAEVRIPEFEPLTASHGGYRTRRNARFSDGLQGLAIWEEIEETEAMSQLGYDVDIYVNSRTLLLFDEGKGVFTRIVNERVTRGLGCNPDETFFHCELLEKGAVREGKSTAAGD